MKTPEEIKKGLEHCVKLTVCSDCPYSECSNCDDDLFMDCLAYIQQLERERDAAVERCIVADEDYADLYWETKRMETAAPKWISVEERLPEEFMSVLVYMPGEDPLPTVHEAYKASDGCWHSAFAICKTGEVTHWMPLPSTEGLNDT